MWERIVQIFKKEMIQIFRDKRMRLLVFFPPLVQLIIFGYAATTDVKHISLAALDEDRTTVSRQFVEKFEAGGYFSVKYYLSSPAEADVLMDNGQVDAFIYIKKGFEQAIRGGGKRRCPHRCRRHEFQHGIGNPGIRQQDRQYLFRGYPD